MDLFNYGIKTATPYVFDLNSEVKLFLGIISWYFMKPFYLDRDFLGSRWNL